METWLNWLSAAVGGTPWLALAGAFGWGVASLVLSPCHLASIPLVVGFIGDRGRTRPGEALGLAALFAGGTLGAIAVVGAITAALGRLLGDLGPWPAYLVAALLVVVGLHLLGVLSLDFLPAMQLPRYRGKAAALALGFVFGLALGPCTFAFLAPVLGVVFETARSSPGRALLLLAAYGAGHGLMIVGAGMSVGQAQRLLQWHEGSRGFVWLKRACGVLVLAGAGWLAHGAA